MSIRCGCDDPIDHEAQGSEDRRIGKVEGLLAALDAVVLDVDVRGHLGTQDRIEGAEIEQVVAAMEIDVEEAKMERAVVMEMEEIWWIWSGIEDEAAMEMEI
jgi:hypothetical protein